MNLFYNFIHSRNYYTDSVNILLEPIFPAPCPRAWEVVAYDFMTPTQLIGGDLVSAENNRNSQIENKTINQKSCTLKASCLCCVSFVY